MFDLNSRTKPVLKWAGGKSGILTDLLLHFPDRFDRYVEPFLGGGAVFLSLKVGTKAIISDSNLDLINLYKVIRDKPKGLMTILDSWADLYSEAFYFSLRTARPESKVNQAARLLYLNKTCFNGLYRENSKGEFNVPFGKRVRCPTLYDRENLLRASDRLKDAEIMDSDFEAVINRSTTGDLVYCDPPYQPLSTTSSFQGYTPQGFPLSFQERLRDCCVRAANRGATVIISSSDSESVKTLFTAHKISEVFARRKINSKGDKRGKISELLIRM